MGLSVQEEQFVRKLISMCAISYPKLLIKYYNLINKKGGFPNRLLISAIKFTAIFSNIGYLGIKRIMDK